MHALGELLRRRVPAATMLDFGTGSGILAIAAALAGLQVEAVDIDAESLVNARENAELNQVNARLDLRTSLSEPARPFDLVFANVINDVLLEFAEALCSRISSRGTLVLSGLTAQDIPGVPARYQSLLPAWHAEVRERGSWRAVLLTQ